MHSIRRKLLITLIGALLAAGFTTAAATFFSAQTEFNKFLDTHLKETAESLAQSVTHSFPLADLCSAWRFPHALPTGPYP